MVQPLSEQLSDLSDHAKKAEETIASAKKERHDKVMARRDQTRAAVQAAMEKVDQGIQATGNSVAANWNALKAKNHCAIMATHPLSSSQRASRTVVAVAMTFDPAATTRARTRKLAVEALAMLDGACG